MILDGSVKGIPGVPRPFPSARSGAKSWNVLREDLPLPLAVLRQSALTSITRSGCASSSTFRAR